MSTAAAAPASPGDAAEPKPKSKKKLIMMAVPVLLLLAGAGGWFSGVLPKMLGMGGDKKPVVAGAPADVATTEPKAPVFADMPLIIANLNVAGRKPVFVKLTSKLELAKPEDQAVVTAAMPRLLDLFQTYLRETRPEELQGAAGTWRLRQELIARANVAATPARVLDVLFIEMLVQ